MASALLQRQSSQEVGHLARSAKWHDGPNAKVGHMALDNMALGIQRYLCRIWPTTTEKNQNKCKKLIKISDSTEVNKFDQVDEMLLKS
uniref:Uncharacterized protein n=1 Tax=Romanomermis culicivorax TaxID=13658 RepID=A0A915JXD6_ROMCU